MARKWNKALAFGLALCMCVGSMNVSAWATTEKVEFPTAEGAVNETIEVEVTVNENKISAKTEEDTKSPSGLDIDVDGEFETNSGEIVNGELKYTAENSDGTYSANGGYEVKTEELAPGDVVEDLTVKLEQGASDKIENKDSEPVIEGDDDRTDGEWDYTETTTSNDREVTVYKVTEGETEVVKDETNYEAPVAPENYEGKHYNTQSNSKTNPQADGLGLHYGQSTAPNLAGPQPAPAEDGYDFYLSGFGEFTDAAAPVFKQIVYLRDENGNPIPDGNGGYLINENESKLINGTNFNNGSTAGANGTGMDFQPAQLALTYKDGKFYAYCADYLVPADGGTEQDPGHWYKLENLEDSGHYSEEDAEKLRAIALNGYWGPKEGLGSLQEVKNLLSGAYGNDFSVTLKDENNEDVVYTLEAMVNDLKEHEALAVTQAAIWAYSINRTALLNGADGVTVVGAQSAIKCYTPGPTDEYRPANNQLENLMAITGKTKEQLAELGFTAEVLAAREAEALRSDARMKALFDCLMGLEGVSRENENVTTIINEKNWVDEDSLQLTVKDKVSEGEANENGEETDIYNADLSFKLEFKPSRDANDLLVYVTYGEETIVKRLSGDPNDDRYITPDENGVYTITGLQFAENSDFTFDLKISGTQKLKESAYLYTAEGGRLASQTLVGLTTGSRDFEISKSYTLEVNVEENSTVKTEHFWRNEETTEPEVPEKPEEPEYPNDDEDPIEPQDDDYEIEEEDIPLVDIPDEEIPLASVPQTGVNNTPWSLMIAAAGLALAAVLGKKNK